MSQSPVTVTSGNPADPDALAAGSGGELTIRHNARIAGITCVIAFVLALAWLGKAVAGGSVWDWMAVLVLAVIAGIEFATLRDAGVPLLVADPTGIRIRRGTEWTGLPWLEIDKVRVRGRSGGHVGHAQVALGLDDLQRGAELALEELALGLRPRHSLRERPA
ncbi:MAG TPA: hypothetical protein PLO27_07865, partial [Marmoricola sp.]|nr:hypothetical protein [Marmoricola sp.]